MPADDLAEEAFVVLREALKRTKKVGIGQLAMRGQEYVVSLKPCGRGMVLETLRYADEVNSASSYFRDIGDTKPDADLLDLAETLIEKKASEFDAGEFQNRYVDALKKLIAEKRKKKGKRVIQDDEPDRTGQGLQRHRPDGGAEEEPWRRQAKAQPSAAAAKTAAPRRRRRAKKAAPARKRALSHGAQDEARHRDLQPQARLHEDRGAARAESSRARATASSSRSMTRRGSTGISGSSSTAC